MIKHLLFILIMIYAGVYDIKYRIVPIHVHILLFMTGLLDVSLSSVIGSITCFMAILIATLIQPTNNVGGGDVYINASIGFCLGFFDGMGTIALSMIIGLIVQPIIWKVKKRKNSFPLVPYFLCGSILYLIIKLFWRSLI